MSGINRREFLAGSAAALVAGWSTIPAWAKPNEKPSAKSKPRINDTVILGKTKIATSRLAIGTGTDGGKQQRDIGPEQFNKLLRHGLDEGVSWWDTADRYKTMPIISRTLKEIPRDKVVITSKTWCRDKPAQEVRKEIERFRSELKTDYIDIMLLHCMEDPRWPEKMKAHMDVLSEAKEKGWIRAHGTSCHTLGALQAAADNPWVEVDLARFNPYAKIMDVKTADEIDQVEKALTKMHARGCAVYVMKLIGNGTFKSEQIDKSLAFALSKPFITGLNIGFTNPSQVDDIARRIERLTSA